MPTLTVRTALDAVAAAPNGDKLAHLARTCLLEAAAGREQVTEAHVGRCAAALGLERGEADTAAGNALDALSRSPSDADSAVLAAALLARSFAADPASGMAAEDEAARRLVWLASHAGVDALAAIDEAMQDKAGALWGAVADLLGARERSAATLPRAEALVAAAALGASRNAVARSRAGELACASIDPALSRLLRPDPQGPAQLAAACVSGEQVAAPRGPIATAMLAACGWLLAAHVARLLARFALRYRRLADVRLTPRGVLVQCTTSLLGRVVRKSESLLPTEGLVRATREVRYPRLGTYAGLVALALGSWLGVSWLVDGVRAGSVSLVAVGALLVAGGIGLDLALATLLPGLKGRCRVLLVPRKGPAVCIANVDIQAADAMLGQLAKL